MGPVVKYVIAGIGAVLVAIVVNVATSLLTEKWDLAGWVGVTVALVLCGLLQAWIFVSGSPKSREQKISRVRARKGLKQKSSGPGKQEVSDAYVGDDLSQEQ